MGKLAAERDRKERETNKRVVMSLKINRAKNERTLAAAAKRLSSTSPMSYTMTQREQCEIKCSHFLFHHFPSFSHTGVIDRNLSMCFVRSLFFFFLTLTVNIL